jgi:hypothetical protein
MNSVYVLGLALSLGLPAQSLTSSQRDKSTLPPALYQEVLNLLFPLPPPIQPEVVLTMSVRFVGAFGEASQLNVVLWENRGPEVEYSQTEKTVSEVFDAAMHAGQDTSPLSIAARARVIHKTVKVPVATVFQWQRDLFSAWSKTLPRLADTAQKEYAGRPTTISLDGTEYQISYAQLQHAGQGSFGGGGPIDRWAETVRKEVRRLLQ